MKNLVLQGKLDLGNRKYCKITSSNTSRLEANVGFFRLLMKGIFGMYVLWPFDKKLIFSLVIRIPAQNSKSY